MPGFVSFSDLHSRVRGMLSRDRQAELSRERSAKVVNYRTGVQPPPRVVEQDFGQPGRWDPKYPEFESEHSTRELYPLSEDQNFEAPPIQNGFIEPAWVRAPSDSHVDSFRLFDARNRGTVIHGGRSLGNSRIQVRFKPSGKRGVTEYDYFFSDHDVAQAVFTMLTSADSPGEIVHAVLIGNKVPYVRRA